MRTILVQMENRRFTMQALHLALALARNQQAQVVLLRLIPVKHLGYLGTSLGQCEMSADEQAALRDYAATAEDYGMDITLRQMQCEDTLAAVTEAADYLDADVVFAQVRPSWLPYWQVFRRWWLEQQLALHGRQLYTLQTPPAAASHVPMITVKPARHSTIK
jgi:hypothetical protein